MNQLQVMFIVEQLNNLNEVVQDTDRSEEERLSYAEAISHCLVAYLCKVSQTQEVKVIGGIWNGSN